MQSCWTLRKTVCFTLLHGFEQEAEEDIGGEQHQGKDDGASQAAPGTHALLFLLFGFLFCSVFFPGCSGIGGVAAASEASVAVGGGGLFHACLVGGRGCGFVFGRGVEIDAFLPSFRGVGRLVATWGDTGLGNGLAGLQQALRADDHAIIGDQLLVADFQLLAAFGTGPAHSFLVNGFQQSTISL